MGVLGLRTAGEPWVEEGLRLLAGSKERKNLWMMKGILGAIPNIAKNNYLEGWAVH